jgi:hypothetical protein
MLLAVTMLCGAILGWEAAKDGLLLTAPSAVAVAAALTLAGYLRFLWKDWRGAVGRLLRRGSRDFQREAVGTLAWSLLFRLLVMGAAGVLVYWVSGLYR